MNGLQPYINLSQTAKCFGGPENYISHVYQNGFIGGATIVGTVAVTLISAYAIYKKHKNLSVSLAYTPSKSLTCNNCIDNAYEDDDYIFKEFIEKYNHDDIY